MAAAAMTADVKTIYKALWSDVLELHATWNLFRSLFMTDVERVKLLNQSGAAVFGKVQDLLFVHAILTISVLADAAEKRKNLTLESLIGAVDSTIHAALMAKLRKCLQRLDSQTKTIRKQRNKRIAHCDRAMRIGTKKHLLPGVAPVDIEAALFTIREYLNEFGTYFGEVFTPYEEADLVPGAVQLLARLKESVDLGNY
jgi:hypothetical protein